MVLKENLKKKDFEKPYVVKIHKYFSLGETKPCFSFSHPNFEAHTNARYNKLEWKIEQDGTLHGFAGYFDSTLYKDINMSIYPPTFSKTMISWFPIYFPLYTPITVKKDDKLVLHFWRCCTDKKVWYEWGVSEPEVQPISNPNGRSYWIGL